ncbi:MAG: asparagine synthase (glutamine-hydrolyzing) [Candidatus Yonathbacteria bacterium RIFCSPHIGHO2_01_FULL_44_41]|uniref:asparagine synthase (glutamine-hydrolyzing) n=1 Tax=Candidatus Yonathbacteria bacterium RIFCSPHIGHO2_02_FULL_44_14 TaxID=1802724 RepID=A0A1G2S6P7_9BACT|nr:MAG: asparagine synthase (glutamine-hydrolyzing) [Candidatus Yonathbacteria bacterium RIFCSPHIGHO2_01_FULL_44_41]OHA80369.1 MAG: asparagine synthase (glutamine-hydrolyzing) [Candidatus Yonathbacteria bacterium RIFCSPHIGHO2_02_FULL_44_14]OHA80677.1 MAG: asparagine synthase (glutamine-hydrolyzing) [Candidatus Yonathbacteria bacterium RIFCSPLOWO2_01_FULL_43_20]
MCGINGFNFIDKGLIHEMNETTKHRGPDDTGVFLSKNYSLGHNRLSIIDLSQAGHQPMHSEDKRYTIVYNGEVYNFLDIKKELIAKGYKFVSHTDTEVILCAYEEWGSGCLEKLNGMFALAILDNQTGQLFLARDRVGIKPLYYYCKDGIFIFSSEAKAIFKHKIDKTINKDALNIYFRLLYIPAPLTIWENIYKLEPGHYAFVEGGNIKIERYWGIDEKPLIYDKKYIESEISNLLTDSIKMQLVSDRSVGVFLSGGIDSTIIAGVTSSFSKNIKTFSVGFEETAQAEKYNNDAKVARRTAEYFNTTHTELTLSANDVKSSLEDAIYHMDEPISNHVQAVNLLLAREASKQVAVVLGGDGGDELFGGYERYYYNYLIDRFQKIPKFLRKNIITETIFRTASKSSLYEKINTPPGVSRYLNFLAQKEDQIGLFLRKEYNNPDAIKEWYEKLYFSTVDEKNFTRQFMRTDLFSWLPSESLVRSDKMSMASGLEQRVPFLDHRLVELADRIPLEYKIGGKGMHIGKAGTGYKGKDILKKAMSKYLPDFVLDQPKWGWFSPAAKWIRGDLKGYFEEVLSPSYCEGTKDMFDFDAIQKILKDHQSGQKYALNTLWSIFTFQIWYKRFME